VGTWLLAAGDTHDLLKCVHWVDRCVTFYQPQVVSSWVQLLECRLPSSSKEVTKGEDCATTVNTHRDHMVQMK
jgi:hypothetical protein